MIDIAALVRDHIEGAVVEAVGDGGAGTQVRVVSEKFEGLSRVKRTQMVYAALSAPIREGSLHSVSIFPLTPAEAEHLGRAS